MKVSVSKLLPLISALPLCILAHTPVAAPGLAGKSVFTEQMRQHILDEYLQSAAAIKEKPKTPDPLPEKLRRPVTVASTAGGAPSWLHSIMMASIAPLVSAPAGNGALMAASFAPFKPKVRYYWDSTTFYEESDNMPDNMLNRMYGITSWQQQVPLPVAYFASTTNPETTTTSLGYGQPNYWRLPLVPTVAASPTLIFTPGSTTNNFQRGGVALASNGIAIFNPANNTGRVSYEIGELDYYGGHCGQADDYHYHIIPMHLSTRFGGPLSDDKPIAWALDGYPIYGYVEPDGSVRQTLDAIGGHDHGNGWGYHYHAIGTNTVDATHPYGTPQSPYMMTSFKGTVVNFGGQVDGQPEITPIRQSGTGGYTAQPVNGALFNANAYKNPVALTTDGSGNLMEDTSAGAVASPDNYRLRATINGTDYDECWKINRNANPKTLTITWRLPGATTTTTYTPSVTSNAAARLTTYPLAGWSELKLPDTGETLAVPGAPFGEDSDYTINPPSLTDNGNGTITDNVTGLMWQKTDAGESTWATAVANAPLQLTAGYTDWRLPTPAELFSILNHNNNPALDQTKFPNTNSADYWWTSDIYGTDPTHVWCTNAGGGLGPKPITETISAGGSLRYNTRYVRGGKPNNGHNYVNNNDGTITDTDTSLMWTQMPAAPMSWQSAISYAENLTSGGYSDWRLPTVKELQTLTDYTLTTAAGTTGIKPSMNRTMFAKTLTNCTTTAGGTTITCNDTTGLIPGMVLVDTVNPGDTYLPGATPPVVASVTNATTFTLTSGTGILASSAQTYKALVPPTAYWTSSVVKSGTLTQAWLVEMGINNSVPAQSGPTRNAQGIISYEVFASTYPVFAVRTTSTTTQIAVAQGSNTLTDGVSTVGYTGTGTKTFTITNNGVTSLTLNGVTIDGTNASNFVLVGAPANPTTLAAGGTVTFGVMFSNASAGTSYGAALHIASSDTAVGTAFDITLTGNVAAIDSIATNPAVPSVGDSPYVTAKITPTAGKTLSQVQLSYSVGTGSTTSTTAFNETMSGTATTNGWSGTLASYPWTTVINGGNGNANQTGAASNHTTPILLSNCNISGTSVTCSSTIGLWPGMIVTGTGIPGGDTIGAVNSATNFTLATTATNGTGVTVTVAGVTLTGCATNSATASVASTISSTSSPNITVASANGLAVGNLVTGTGIPNSTYIIVISGTTVTLNNNPTATGTPTLTFGGNAVTCASTTGLVAGMGITGTGIPINSTVYQVNNSTSFLLSSAATTTNSGQTFTASGCGLQFNKGSTSAACSATTITPVDLSGLNNGTTSTSATISFWASASNLSASTVGWSLQLSPDGGTTWPASTSTGAVTEFAAANHGYTQYNYTLQQSELTNNVKLRFNFNGNGTGGSGAAKFAVDDITITKTTTTTPPTFTVTMYDDGTHGDVVGGDGIYTGQITDSSAKVAGAVVSYSIKEIYTDSTFTALASPLTYTVTGPTTITTSGTLPNALTSAAYTQSLVASGGSGSGYTWSITGGSLPPGITFGTNGTLSGTATTTGTFNFTATVSDSSGHTASQPFTLTISTPPNILIILTDDQGWADIGYHTYPGRVHIDTPNMDSFATSGIRMERFYPTAVCSVTRACLHTGRNTIRTGVNNSRGLDLSEHIMPQTFNAAGYQTFITGKWHCGGPENNICYKTINGQTVRVIQEGDQYRPFNRGWKLHYGEYGVIDAFTHYSSSLLNPITQPTWLMPDWWLNGVQYADGDASQHTDAEGHGGYATDLLADKAISIITNSNGDRDPTKPLLLYLPFSQVHGPVSAPPSYLAKYGNASDPTHYIADLPTRTIAASVDCLDVAMGRVLAALDSQNMTNNTFVLFMSDNGGENATGGCDLPLRGAKTEPYEGGVRTPCGLRFPGKLAGGLQVPNCVTTAGTTVTCSTTAGLYAGMALAGTGLAYGTTVASVTDATHFVLSAAPTTPSTPSSITLTAGVISNMYFWVGDIFPTICAASGVTPQNTKPFDGLNMWPALQTISGANPNGTQTRFQTNPDGSKNTTTTNISPLVTLATPNVAYNTYTDPISGQTKVFKDIYSPSTSAVILTHCATIAGNTTVTCDSTAGLTTGGSIYGVGIKGGATVASITDTTHFVMSDPPNVAYANITLNVGFPTNQLFNIEDDPNESTDYLLAVNQTALGLTQTQITQFNAIAAAMQSAISITPAVYPPYVGPTLITNTATQGSTIQLYAPFTSYAKNAPTINWRKNGVNLADGTTASGSTVSGSTTFTVNTTSPDPGYGNPSVPTNGAYTTVLTITNVTSSDAGSYDLVINNVDTSQTPNATNTVTSPAGTLTVVVGSPALTILPAYTKGASQTVSWATVTNATSYTVQAATDVNFINIIASQTVSTTSATFGSLTSGTQYWFRATATDGITTSAYSNTVMSTQDAVNPVVAITTPADGATTSQTTVNVQGTSADALSGIASVSVNGVAATTADGYAHWSASVPLTVGGNTVTATAADAAGNTSAASITVSLSPVTPVISAVTTGPTSPTYMDSVYVVARVQAGQAPISQVRLSYNTATPVSTTIWREVFSNAASNSWNGTGALNAWTPIGGGNVRLASGSSNHTIPLSISGAATTSGSTTVNCSSTACLWIGMQITGPNIPGSISGAATGNTTVSAVTNASTFVLSQAATGTGTGLSLTAAGATLTNAITTTASATVTCDSTAGLINGMSLSGTGLPTNASVFSVPNSTTFVMNTNATASGTGLTITASGTAAEFNGGSTSLTGSMITTSNVLNTTGTAGYVEFYVQTRDLAAPTTTVNVSGVVTSGSAVVTSSTTASLGVGMLVQGTGIATGASVVSIDSASQFTMSAAATNAATGAATAIAATNNNQWNFQVSPDGGTTWNTRLSEDWNSKVLPLANVVTNSAASTTGSTTVTCASTSGLTTGRTIIGPNVYLTGSTTSGSAAVMTTSTSMLAVGLFLTGSSGIPNSTRILSIDSATQFTMSANATATSASNAIAATYFAPSTTVSSITNGTTLVLSSPAYVNTSTAPISASTTTLNHAFQLFHYDLTGTELGTNTKMRWQFAGYVPTSPTAKPRVDVDDIIVATTAPPANIVLTMYDDGLHGDGAANDGYYGVLLPAQNGGTTVNFTITATDTSSGVTVNPTSGSFTYSVSLSLTDSTIKGAEFLGMPTDTSMTLNVIASVDQQAFIEYGTTPGSYTSATTPTLFSVDTAHPEFYNPIEITLTGLQPDTECYYRFRHKSPSATFYNARGERSFHTARPRGRPFVFTITADPHLDVNTDQSLLDRAMTNIAADSPDFHIDLGDIFMTDKMEQPLANGIPAIWGGELSTGQLNQSLLNNRAILLRNQFELFCHSVPYFFTLGNHEAEYGYLFSAATDKLNNIPAWDLLARKSYFPTPVPSTFYGGNPTPMNYTGGTLGLLEDYYAWEWGDALYIVLDPFWNTTTNPSQTNDAWNWSLGQTQYNWLRDTLKNSSAKYKFVFTHHIVGGTTTLADGVTPNVAARGGIEVAGFYEWGGLNADGNTNGFATHRPGWDMPIHQLLVQNKVSAVFHGHDHLYGYQTLNGLVYLECPQPGTANYATLGSAADGKYTQSLSSLLLADSGHIRVTVTSGQVIADYVRAYRPQDETTSRHNRDVSNSFTLRPTVFPPIEMLASAPGQVILRWNALPNKPYQIQYSTDLVTWQNITTTPLTFINTSTNATYTDTLPARVNGQRAFYRVSYTP